MPHSTKPSELKGVEFKDSEWHACAFIGRKKIHIGTFSSARAAAVARDMELLRCRGEDAADELNLGYDVVSSTDTELVVLDDSGAKICISLSIDKEYAPIEPPPMKNPQREVITASLVLPNSWPRLPYNCEPWATRTQTASQVSAAFCYEIKFPFQSSLGLNLKPHFMMYSQAGGGKFVGCLTVVDAVSSLATVIHPGDILLRVNDTELVLPGHLFDFERATRAITSASTPRTLRLMRPYCPASPPSPTEMVSLARDPNPIAKFLVVAHGDNPLERTLQLSYADPQIPAVVKRNLSGPELPYNHTAMPNHIQKPPKTNFRASVAAGTIVSVQNGEESFVVMGTLYRDRTYTSGGPGASAFATGAGPPPNGGGLVNTALGGLMISNSCVVSIGKWCVYLSVGTVKNVVVEEKREAAPLPPPVAGLGFGSAAISTQSEVPKPSIKVTQVPCDIPHRRYLVGKYDTEHDAKLNMEMATDIAFSTGSYTPALLVEAWARKRAKDAPPPAPVQPTQPPNTGFSSGGEAGLAKKGGGVISFSAGGGAVKPVVSSVSLQQP